MSAPPPNLPISGEWHSGGFDIPAPAPEQPTITAPTAPRPMAIVLPFIEREREQVLNLLTWIPKLSGYHLNRTVFLVPLKGLKIDDVLIKAREAFADVQVIADSEGAASDWKKDVKVRNAAGPNSLFRQAAWFFHLRPKLGPWLWLEPDAVPLVPDWDDRIETAYRAAGKPFSGARMKFHTGDEYLNGVAVYPRDAVGRAPALVTRATWAQFPEMEIAFDVAGGMEVLRQSHFTDLIQLDYRSDGARPRNGAVLFHGDRDGSILEKLLSGGVEAGLRGQPQRTENPKLQGHAGSDARYGLSKTQDQSRSRGRRAEVRSPRGGSVPPAQNSSNQNGAIATSVGDEIRFHVDALVALASNANRRTRTLKALRRAKLLPRGR